MSKKVLGAVGVVLAAGVVVSGAACWRTLRNGPLRLLGLVACSPCPNLKPHCLWYTKAFPVRRNTHGRG